LQEDKMVKMAAFNYNRIESDLKGTDEDELKSMSGEQMNILKSGYKTKNLTEQIRSQEKGVVLWKWFIILALGFLLAEILLLRLFKT